MRRTLPAPPAAWQAASRRTPPRHLVATTPDNSGIATCQQGGRPRVSTLRVPVEPSNAPADAIPANRPRHRAGSPSPQQKQRHVRQRKVRRTGSGPRRLVRPGLRARGRRRLPGGPRQQPRTGLRLVRKHSRFGSGPWQTPGLQRPRQQPGHSGRLQTQLPRGDHPEERVPQSVHWGNLRGRASLGRTRGSRPGSGRRGSGPGGGTGSGTFACSRRTRRSGSQVGDQYPAAGIHPPVGGSLGSPWRRPAPRGPRHVPAARSAGTPRGRPARAAA